MKHKKENSINSQSKRTRMHICNAMMELMKTNDFSDITISSIAEYAELSRGSFYSHYSNKEDVIREILQNIINDNYRGSQCEGLSVFDGWLIVYNNFIRYRDFLVSVGDNNLIYLWQEISMQNYSKITTLYLNKQKLITEDTTLFHYFKIYHGMALPYLFYELLKKYPQLSAKDMVNITIKVRQQPHMNLLAENQYFNT